MSLDIAPPEKVNDCQACNGTGVQGWIMEDEYEVRPCDICMKD